MAHTNHILARLARADLRLIERHLQEVDLPLRKPLESRNRRIEHVYFVESGFASVVANGQRNIEIGVIGREGMSGLTIVLGAADPRPRNDTYIQMAGHGRRLTADNLRKAISASVPLHHVMLRYAHSFMVQTSQTALANGRSKIEERLARWLLMADDRTDGDGLPLTHEFLSVMLGVQRSGVTVALQGLERLGIIALRRGVITILDREALEKSSNGTYFRLDDE